MRLLTWSVFCSIFITLSGAKRSDLGSFLEIFRRLGVAKFDDADPCDDEKISAVKKCLAPFYSSFGYNISHLPSVVEFEDQLEDIIDKEGFDKGIKKECTITRKMSACLSGIEGAESCQNIPSYKTMLGVDELDAPVYLIINVHLGYQCANEQVYRDNRGCMGRAWKEQFVHMLMCTTELLRELGHDDKCYAYSGWISCMEQSFAQTCGRKIYTFWCNMMELPFLAIYPDCMPKMPGCEVRPTPPSTTSKSPKRLSKRLDYHRYDMY